jgi:tRNA-dihydrouridine synthase C
VPVRPQLLGSDPVCLAENAARVAGMGPYGVDLNFGCPAKVVNRHGGGAALLQEPELIATIVSAVRRAVPAGAVVSAKMRLGFHDTSLALDCARAIAGSGADELVVHARTRADGYRPPAYWDQVAAIRAAVAVPVVANGEIWTLADALRCRAESGGDSLMLGRGMVAHPGLALALRQHDQGQPALGDVVPWTQMLPLLESFWALVHTRLDKKAQVGRLKQWLNFLRRTQPQAEVAYQALRTANDPGAVHAWFQAQSQPSTTLQH